MPKRTREEAELFIDDEALVADEEEEEEEVEDEGEY